MITVDHRRAEKNLDNTGGKGKEGILSRSLKATGVLFKRMLCQPTHANWLSSWQNSVVGTTRPKEI
jgi:hypothetical protein